MPIMKEKKYNWKELLVTIIWSIKLGFQLSPIFYTLKFVTRIIQSTSTIAEVYFDALAVTELVRILASGNKEITSQLIVYLIGAAALVVLRNANNYFIDYIRIRFNYKFTEEIFSRYLAQLGRLDVQYHEDPAFKTL